MSGRIVIMGSGETAPTMVKLHRTLIAESGDGARAMLDTPFGFQANADDLTAKVQEYFADAVGAPLEVARWRRRDEPSTIRERSLELLHRARFVFAGPGSPTYALHQWEGTAVPDAMVETIQRGGTVVLGSAAAVTAGAWSVPVYEIYKVGEEPRWVPGLDLLGSILGMPAAVIPHFDNREGGRHDTRFCYLGEQRLNLMEDLLPSGVGVLGVDEHTAVVMDTAAGRADVHGAGGMTIRAGARVEVVPAGESISLDDLSALLAGASVGLGDAPSIPPTAVIEAAVDEAPVSLKAIADETSRRFNECLDKGDADGALECILELDDTIHDWAADTLQGDDQKLARRTLRAMLVRLAGAAVEGLKDPRDTLDPVMQVVLDARARARAAKDFATSDALRDGLLAAGIEVRDTPDGVVWAPTGVERT